MKRFITICIALLLIFSLTACKESWSQADTRKTLETVSNLQERQPTPTDLDFSLERYNLIRRAYWVNGQREKSRLSDVPGRETPYAISMDVTSEVPNTKRKTD